MKQLIIILAIAVSFFILTQGGPVHAQSQSDQPYVEQSTDAQGSGGMQQPQGGARSLVPLFFLLIIYLVIRRMFKRMGGGDNSPFGSGRDFDKPGSQKREDDPDGMNDVYDSARKMWDTFNARPDAPKPGQDVPAGEPSPAPQPGQQKEQPAKVIDINGKATQPTQGAAESDDEFLMGARLVFERMVEAMDGLDPDAAAHFAGPTLVNEIKLRMNDGHPPAASEVVSVDAKVMSRSVENGITLITVYYDAIKNVSGIGPIGPVQMREVWTFTKDDNDPAAMWMLQAMDPVEA